MKHLNVVITLKNGDVLRFEKARLMVTYAGALVVLDESDSTIRLAVTTGEWITAREERAP